MEAVHFHGHSQNGRPVNIHGIGPNNLNFSARPLDILFLKLVCSLVNTFKMHFVPPRVASFFCCDTHSNESKFGRAVGDYIGQFSLFTRTHDILCLFLFLCLLRVKRIA